MASSLFDRITSYVAYIQHMRGPCVVHLGHDVDVSMKGQRSKSHGSFQFVALSAPWLCFYLTESLHM